MSREEDVGLSGQGEIEGNKIQASRLRNRRLVNVERTVTEKYTERGISRRRRSTR
jgi:hypothetical protein